jgi:ribonuclease VapC
MVIDSSAIVAMLLEEGQARAIDTALRGDDVLLLAAPTRAEMGIVVHGRLEDRGVRTMRRLLDELGVVDVPFDRSLADAAADAYAVWGKGHHPARLNMGDCFTYAVAKRTGEPILCVGDDFSRTDVAVVPLGDLD